MTTLYGPRSSYLIAGLLLLAAVYAGWEGGRRLARGLREAAALEVVRGIRRVVLAFVAGLAVLAVLSGETGYLVLGAVVLGEELYETGVLAAIIRLGERGGDQVGSPGPA